MQVRWNYKLQPNVGQADLMAESLVTLRKHRNYCLAERKRGFETNNQDADQPVMYNWYAYCDLETRFISGAYSPLTCPVLKHGVLSAELTKVSKGQLAWGSATDIQTTLDLQLTNVLAADSQLDSVESIAKLKAQSIEVKQEYKSPSYTKRLATNERIINGKPHTRLLKLVMLLFEKI